MTKETTKKTTLSTTEQLFALTNAIPSASSEVRRAITQKVREQNPDLKDPDALAVKEMELHVDLAMGRVKLDITSNSSNKPSR